MKLSSFEGNNQLTITQTAHGASQGNCAFDFGWGGGPINKVLYAPCDGTVYTEVATSGNDNYFNFSSPDNGEGKNYYIQFVHDKSYGKKFYKKGDPLGKSVKDHHHVAIFFNGWHWIFDYMDRNTNLYWWTYPNQDSKWAKWSSYPTDLQLPVSTPIETCETKLQVANNRIIELETELKKYHLTTIPLYEKGT